MYLCTKNLTLIYFDKVAFQLIDVELAMLANDIKFIRLIYI